LQLGSNKIVFDITCGRGTYLETKEEARRLGKLLFRIGKTLGKEVGYIITLMDEPVGKCVGNVLEIQEAISALNGNMAKDVEDTVINLASIILNLSYGEKDMALNANKVRKVIQNGQALSKFKQMIIAQRRETELILIAQIDFQKQK